MNRFISPCILLLLILLVDCKSDKLKIDVSKYPVTVEIHRFDQELFDTNPDSLINQTSVFYEKYGDFYKHYIENILGVGMVKDPALGYSLKSFVSDKYVKELYEDSRIVDSSIQPFKASIEDAFKHYAYYFPDSTIPDIVFFFSAAQYKVAVTDTYLGIGIDMYIGSYYKNYVSIGLPSYFIETLDTKYMAVDAMKGWLATEIEQPENIDYLIGAFIHQGIIMYLLDAMMPEVPAYIKMGYTKEKYAWCEKNEFQMWAYFIDKELLYTKNEKEISSYLMEGPFTPNFPKESPARGGCWLGWQIVNAFMKNNPDISIQQLLKIEDYKMILNKSNYKPSK